MTMIPAHIELSLDAAEKRIQDLLIDNARERYINGAKVVLSSLVLTFTSTVFRFLFTE